MYALLAGCFGGLVLPLVMKIPSDSGAANLLKWAASVMAMTGTLLGVLVSGFQVEDINFTIVDFGNFVFYFGLTYFLLRNAGKQQDNSRQSQVHRHVGPG